MPRAMRKPLINSGYGIADVYQAITFRHAGALGLSTVVMLCASFTCAARCSAGAFACMDMGRLDQHQNE